MQINELSDKFQPLISQFSDRLTHFVRPRRLKGLQNAYSRQRSVLTLENKKKKIAENLLNMKVNQMRVKLKVMNCNSEGNFCDNLIGYSFTVK